ncbi:hypothetical protein CTI12_AA104540 [Artemisia annua]|uniref:COI1 F-box domain-containing protein n=1 Tax=Artemisia annua TaxID=35608 RepID=A0A2U1P9D1_ARTAN|nr:hypothetical protein CTI12_AA104540 [Artemisia annua]
MEELVLDCVMPYIQDNNDVLNSVSLVSRKYFDIDSSTRKNLTVHVHFAPDPERLSHRFPSLESLTLKSYSYGRDNARKCRIPVKPWIHEIAVKFTRLNSLSIRNMVVSTSDLKRLAKTRGGSLKSLEIRGCKMFSEDGLIDIARYNMKDVAQIAKKCSKSLVSLNIYPRSLSDFRKVFKYAKKLDHFGYAFIDEDWDYSGFEFPPNIRGLRIEELEEASFSFLHRYLNQLRELDLGIGNNCQCSLFKRCPNLEVLVNDDICGDIGLQVIGQFCKKLRKLHHGWHVTHMGLIALAQGCINLEYLNVTLSDISNEAFECVGTHLKNLRDFRIQLDREGGITYLQLDNGVRAMLMGCRKLERLDINLCIGGLTDVGLGYIGEYGHNLRYLSLSYTGESDAGLLELSKGCPKLRKLILRGCPFSEQAIATFVFNINFSLSGFEFPPNIRGLRIEELEEASFSFLHRYLNQLRELDLGIGNNCQCSLFERCPNLEVLVNDDICGDIGLQVIGQFCKKLRKLHHAWHVTHMGLIALAQGCINLEYLNVTLSDISNEAFECVGTHLKNLRDFRIRLDREGGMTYLQLDNGVRAMLMGCRKLERLDINLCIGGLTDVGLGYIGEYGHNLRYLSLSYTGESDAGLLELSKGCPKLRKLILRGCPFSEQAIATFVFNINFSLRYIRVKNDSRDYVLHDDLLYDNLVLISGGSGITLFISIIRELTFRRAQQADKNYNIPTSVLLICAFKNSTDLSMLDLLLPLTSNGTPLDLSRMNFQIQAYITRETEQQQTLENTKKPLRIIWFKPNLSGSRIAAPLGPNSWLCFVFLWQRRTPTTGKPRKCKTWSYLKLERLKALLINLLLKVHFGHRPDLMCVLMENNRKGSDVGVLVCGPGKMRHEVAKICSSKEAKKLHLESISFNG